MLSDRAVSQNLELYPHSNINLQFISEMFYFSRDNVLITTLLKVHVLEPMILYIRPYHYKCTLLAKKVLH